MKRTKILITLKEGVITDVTSTEDVEVTIIDFDTDSEDGEGMTRMLDGYARIEEYGEIDICTEEELKQYINQ